MTQRELMMLVAEAVREASAQEAARVSTAVDLEYEFGRGQHNGASVAAALISQIDHAVIVDRILAEYDQEGLGGAISQLCKKITPENLPSNEPEDFSNL